MSQAKVLLQRFFEAQNHELRDKLDSMIEKAVDEAWKYLEDHHFKVPAFLYFKPRSGKEWGELKVGDEKPEGFDLVGSLGRGENLTRMSVRDRVFVAAHGLPLVPNQIETVEYTDKEV